QPRINRPPISACRRVAVVVFPDAGNPDIMMTADAVEERNSSLIFGRCIVSLHPWVDECTRDATAKDVTWNNARLVRELHADEIAAMKQRPGKNIMIASAADQSCRS